MKLRNKKTGKIGNLISGVNLDEYQIVTDDYRILDKYDSLAELIEDWEDYKPAEPLIKDEKIRKAVRAWAEANDVEKLAVLCHSSMEESVTEIAKIDNASLRIVFSGDLGIKRGYTFTDYTIAELCGEEEE